jgi:hypothetical protein
MQRHYHRERRTVDARQAKIKREAGKHGAISRIQTLKENKRVLGQCGKAPSLR